MQFTQAPPVTAQSTLMSVARPVVGGEFPMKTGPDERSKQQPTLSQGLT